MELAIKDSFSFTVKSENLASNYPKKKKKGGGEHLILFTKYDSLTLCNNICVKKLLLQIRGNV